MGDQRLAVIRLAEKRNFVWRYLKACEVTFVVADTDIRQARLAEVLLRLIDHGKTLGRNLLTIGDATRQAGCGRFVPDR